VTRRAPQLTLLFPFTCTSLSCTRTWLDKIAVHMMKKVLRVAIVASAAFGSARAQQVSALGSAYVRRLHKAQCCSLHGLLAIDCSQIPGARVCTHAHTYTCAHTHTRTHTRTHTHTYTRIYAHARTYAHTHTHTHTHVRTRTHVHTHTRTRSVHQEHGALRHPCQAASRRWARP
jgi:hypothetical protein